MKCIKLIIQVTNSVSLVYQRFFKKGKKSVKKGLPALFAMKRSLEFCGAMEICPL